MRTTSADGQRAGDMLAALEADEIDSITRVLEQLEETETISYPYHLTAYAAYKHAEEDYPDVAEGAARVLDTPTDANGPPAPIIDQSLWCSDQRVQDLRAYVYEQGWCDPYQGRQQGLLDRYMDRE